MTIASWTKMDLKRLSQYYWTSTIELSFVLMFAFFFLLVSLITVSAQIAHHQYFKVSPQNDVDVIEGSTLLLQCVVGNQRGPVQWAKDGFVLGYDRSIPGYPRYSMIGDASLGVHNLRIVDARSEDNGEFQCQVRELSYSFIKCAFLIVNSSFLLHPRLALAARTTLQFALPPKWPY